MSLLHSLSYCQSHHLPTTTSFVWSDLLGQYCTSLVFPVPCSRLCAADSYVFCCVEVVYFLEYICFPCLCYSAIIGRSTEAFKRYLWNFATAMPAVSVLVILLSPHLHHVLSTSFPVPNSYADSCIDPYNTHLQHLYTLSHLPQLYPT